METPNKIYLQVCGDCPQTDCENCNFDDLADNITWAKERIFPKDVEYINKEAFVKKAVEWIDKNAFRYIVTRKYQGLDVTGLDTSLAADFKKALEDML